MTGFQVLQMGPLDAWRDYFGGFRPESSRDSRRVVDHDLTMQYIGMTANAFEPGEEAGYWHTHAVIEEAYVFLTGRGQMGLDDEIVDVGPGTVVQVPHADPTVTVAVTPAGARDPRSPTAHP